MAAGRHSITKSGRYTERTSKRALEAAAGYSEYYLAANLPLEQQIFAPPAPDDFAGQLTIGTEWADTENIKNLVAAFQDPRVQEFLATDPAVKGILLPLDAQ